MHLVLVMVVRLGLQVNCCPILSYTGGSAGLSERQWGFLRTIQIVHSDRSELTTSVRGGRSLSNTGPGLIGAQCAIWIYVTNVVVVA